MFHAAALKRLPLLERYPLEAVKTNVWATADLLEAAAACGVERFVNISTDKAADPSSVLGYSKRIAERLTADVALREQRAFVSVRFGNVLGSRGSVLTTFHAQIDQDGPITVTDPDVTRVFMTLEEAVQLVIQAGAIGRPGDVLALDMGEPVNIADVARLLAARSDRNVASSSPGWGPGRSCTRSGWRRGARLPARASPDIARQRAAHRAGPGPGPRCEPGWGPHVRGAPDVRRPGGAVSAGGPPAQLLA